MATQMMVVKTSMIMKIIVMVEANKKAVTKTLK